jgi:hypothetical protein
LEQYYVKEIKFDTYWKKENRGDRKQHGTKGYSELWKNVVYEMETGRRDFVGWVSKDVAIRRTTTTRIHTGWQHGG